MDIFVNDITLSFLMWFLVSLVSFLLGLLLGYLLWYKYRSQVGQLETKLKEEHDRFVKLETEHASLKYKFDELSKDKTALKESLNRCEGDRIMLQGMLDELKNAQTGEATTKSPDPRGKDLGPKAGGPGVIVGSGTVLEKEPRSFGTIFKPHDLQIIEGIGPKVEGLLNQAGINNWKDLAEANMDRLQQILEKAGPHYRMHNPERWSHEASLALAGKWDELIEYQKSEDSDGNPSPSKVENLAMKKLGFSGSNPEDLKIIEGIGPKIEQLLKDAGIRNWSDLAEASEDHLRQILAEAGDRYKLATPDTWTKQAELAAAGKWSKLNEYQEFLQGGKDPGQYKD